MPRLLRRLENLLHRGLKGTASLWPQIRRGYRYVHTAAAILKNRSDQSAARVRQGMAGLLGAMVRHQPARGSLAQALSHFRKVTDSYWAGLFHCYSVPDLPRTNNDLEHLFGSNRYHERRATGRKAASPAMVLRGPVRLLAATATRLATWPAKELARADIPKWQALRRELERRAQARRSRSRFRRSPRDYLLEL